MRDYFLYPNLLHNYYHQQILLTMKKIYSSSKFKFIISSFVLLSIYSCNDGSTDNISSLTSTESSKVPLIIDSKVPHDVPLGASEEDIANFAWNQFFALNWKSSWGEDTNRFTADQNWTPNMSTPNLAVWETYAHRTELRPADGIMKSIETGKPSYTFTESKKITNNDILQSSKYWNVLDEDNEIGSAYLFANKDESEVLYMAKTNLAEYNYLKTNFNDTTDLQTAITNTKSVFGKLSKSEMCDSKEINGETIVCLPCGDIASPNKQDEGAIEIKLAFKKLSKVDIVDRFITKEVVTFKKGTNGNIIAKVDTLGLIGMHIIHKTKNHPTFIYASFEQVDVRNNNMQTIGIDTVIIDGVPTLNVDPHRLNPVIERSIPETIRKVNENALALIKYQNPNSKWQYYQLIGTQSTPVNYKDRNNHSNYFMANYVIESDLALTNFHGTFSDPFSDTVMNVALNNETYNMGGCMGCHGNAQRSGSDFSFLVSSTNFDEPDLYQTYAEAFQSATSNTQSIIVSAKLGYENTNVFVKPGDIITYTSGMWSEIPSNKAYNANGTVPNRAAPQDFPLPNANIGVLVGKVGDNPAFVVGNGPTTIPTGQSGILKLTINDVLTSLSDNRGNVVVNIKIK